MAITNGLSIHKLGIAGFLAAAAILLALLLPAAPASGALCITPDEGPGKSNTGDYMAEAPVAPDDFFSRGNSMDNRAGKMAAWEAHFNSPVVQGPDSCDDLFE